jgi:5-methylcytosine-specific restriction endonuclease McrA
MTTSHQWKKIRQVVLRRDEYVCAYCNRQVSGRDATVDHIIPRHLAHTTDVDIDNYSNLITACRSCNSSKKHRRAPHMTTRTRMQVQAQPNPFTSSTTREGAA